jgi:hypothetical protein
MVSILDLLSSRSAISKGRIGRTSIVWLEVVNLVVLRVCCSNDILFPIFHTICHNDIAIMAASPWLHYAALLY